MINRVLFYNSGGGTGDAIQILPLIDTLKTKFENSRISYEAILDKTTESIEKFIKNTEASLEKNVQ